MGLGEVELAALLCAFLAGSEEETRHYFDVNSMKRYVRVDCETEHHVIEIGLDGTSSSRDSVHQALFFAHLSGKQPVVILIDRDGHEGRFEYEMRQVAPAAGVLFLTCSQAVITRWAATRALRDGYGERNLDDLPQAVTARANCDLTPLRRLDGAESS